MPPSIFQFTCDQSKGTSVTMNTTTSSDFDFSFLEEGFSARDIVEQKINESSMTVSILCWPCLRETHDHYWVANVNMTLKSNSPGQVFFSQTMSVNNGHCCTNITNIMEVIVAMYRVLTHFFFFVLGYFFTG